MVLDEVWATARAPAYRDVVGREASGRGDAAAWLRDDEQQAWRLLVATMTVLPPALDRQLQREAGLTLFAYQVLARLSEAQLGSLTMSELASTTSASLSRLSHVVAGLERDGRVVRRPASDNGRITVVELTRGGAHLVETTAPGHAAAVRHLVFDALDGDDVASLARVCSAILDGPAFPGTGA